MTTFGPNTATLDECRDFIAECNGWIDQNKVDSDTPEPIASLRRAASAFGGQDWYHPTEEPHERYVGCRYGDHPIPATLDAAAGALPDGWVWSYIDWQDESFGRPVCSAFATRGDEYEPLSGSVVEGQGDSEIPARFRAACLAWIEEEKK